MKNASTGSPWIFGLCVGLVVALSACTEQDDSPAANVPLPAVEETMPDTLASTDSTMMVEPVEEEHAATPDFSEYPSVPRYEGAAAVVQLVTEDHRMMRTRLREVGSQPANFAGEYSFGCWGAGTSNLHCAAINLRTGEVVWAPGLLYHGGYSGGEGFEPLLFRAESRLLVMRGMLNEQEPNGDHYYEMRDGTFHHIITIP